MTRFILLLVITIVPSYQYCHECNGCRNSAQSVLCKCDADCGIFGDCCGSLSPPQSCNNPPRDPLPLGALFECQSIYLKTNTSATSVTEGFQMVSSCPSCFEEVGEIMNNCTSKDVVLPPVTDLKTGLVYRNEYCAYCNGVEALVTWQTDLACSATVHEAILHSNLSTLVEKDPEVILKDCQEISYRQPSLPPGISPPRSCLPTINHCLSKQDLENKTTNISFTEYLKIEKNCSIGIYDPVQGKNGRNYRNSDCARCNAVLIQQCLTVIGGNTNNHYRSEAVQDIDSTLSTHKNTSTVTVSIVGIGKASLNTGKNIILWNCICPEENPLIRSLCYKTPCLVTSSYGKKHCSNFMEVLEQLNECHLSLANCSSKKYNVSRTQNFNSSHPSQNLLQSCASSSSCQRGFKLLNRSEYTVFNETIIYRDEALQSWYIDADFQVFICEDNEGDLIGLICHYIAHLFSIVGVFLAALTYFLFKKVRNLPSTIIINYSIPILLNSVLHFFTEQNGIMTSETVREIFAIALHYFSLVELTWMVIFSYEVLRKFCLGLRMKSDSNKNKQRHLIAYICIGWLPSLVLVSTTVIINYTTTNIVKYGLDERGIYILHFHSFLAAEGLYALICIVLSILLFIIITGLICSRARAKVKLKQKGALTLLKLWIVIVCLSSFSYVPYFINNPQWLVYTMDYYNETRGIFIFLAFFVTKNVFNLYRNLFSSAFCQSKVTPQNVQTSLPTVHQTSVQTVSVAFVTPL